MTDDFNQAEGDLPAPGSEWHEAFSNIRLGAYLDDANMEAISAFFAVGYYESGVFEEDWERAQARYEEEKRRRN